METLEFILVIIAAYVMGSLSISIFMSSRVLGRDIRRAGSGNAGATNMMRIHGKKAGAAVLLCDFSKGLICVAAAKLLTVYGGAPWATVFVAGFFAQLGHTFPVFFGFRGGKGVAAAAGAAFAIMPLTALLLFALFAVIVGAFRFVSLASGVCAALYPLLAYFLNGKEYLVFAACCSALMALKHIPNFIRLLDGRESKISN